MGFLLRSTAEMVSRLDQHGFKVGENFPHVNQC